LDVVRRPARVRLIAGLLACAWALVPLGTLIDGLVTEHVYCAEHQALEHAGESSPEVTSIALGSVRSAGADAEHGEQCQFAQMMAREYHAPGSLAVADAPRATAAEPAAVETDARPLAILSFAPKSSPPA
jgi:hypothetical protein